MKKPIITGAFPEPLFTKVPNKFFDMLPDMQPSEALVTLAMIRETFGYHRLTCTMSIAKLSTVTGVSENSVRAAVESAEERGTFRRTNSGSKKSAEWELIVEPSMVEPATIEGVLVQPLQVNPSTIAPQLGVKEIKEIKETTPAFKHPNNMPIEYYIRANVPVPADWQNPELGNQAHIEFEAALGFGRLTWDLKPEWIKFSKWVVKITADDPQVWRRYSKWRETTGKYTGMSNNKIRQNPDMFMDTGYPFFMASESMYSNNADRSFGL